MIYRERQIHTHTHTHTHKPIVTDDTKPVRSDIGVKAPDAASRRVMSKKTLTDTQRY